MERMQQICCDCEMDNHRIDITLVFVVDIEQ